MQLSTGFSVSRIRLYPLAILLVALLGISNFRTRGFRVSGLGIQAVKLGPGHTHSRRTSETLSPVACALSPEVLKLKGPPPFMPTPSTYQALHPPPPPRPLNPAPQDHTFLMTFCVDSGGTVSPKAQNVTLCNPPKEPVQERRFRPF